MATEKGVHASTGRPCPICSKEIAKDALQCCYCNTQVSWSLIGKIRPTWQLIPMVGPFINNWLKVALVQCKVDWNDIMLFMGNGTTYSLRRGEYEGSFVEMSSIPLTNITQWRLEIKPKVGKRIMIDTLIVEYPNGKKSIEDLVGVLGIKRSWMDFAWHALNLFRK